MIMNPSTHNAISILSVVILIFTTLPISLSSSSSSSSTFRWPWDIVTIVNAFQHTSSAVSSIRMMHLSNYRLGADISSIHNSDQTVQTLHLPADIGVITGSRRRFATRAYNAKTDTSSSTTATATTTSNVLVIGGTSGIGQLVALKLANSDRQPYIVRATSRSQMRGDEIFQGNDNIKVVELDLLQKDTTQLKAAMEGVAVVVISVGTTAFPTIKWRDGNTPVAIDNDAVTRVAKIASEISSVQQVILVTSVGVERTNVMPFLILNLFGVLDAKRAGENAVRQYSTMNSGYQYTIIRPGRLVGGPFTNLDVAKLLQIQGGTENGVTMTRGDALLGDCKRDACAECIVQCITTKQSSATILGNLEFSIISNDQPALNNDEWSTAFQSLF